jgi:hypothetical protein
MHAPPGARDPVPGAELGRGERLGKPGSLLTVPGQYASDISAMARAAQDPVCAAPSSDRTLSLPVLPRRN